MPQENIMANARLQTRKKNSGAENIFLLFQFLLIFPVSKVVQFYIHFVFFSVDLQEGYKITNFDDFSF